MRGTTIAGATAYLITNVTGTRVYTFENGTQQVVQLVSVGGLASVLSQNVSGAFFIGSSSSTFVANNVLYPTFPYFDARGVVLLGSTSFYEEELSGSGQTNVVRVFVNVPSQDFEEWLLDFQTGYYYLNHAGTSLLAPYNASLATADFAQQCSYTYGTLNTYQFCYTLDDSSLPVGLGAAVVSAYGTFQAYGPQTCNGRANALQVVAMNGVRSIKVLGATSNTTTNQNIVSVKYVNADLSYGNEINNNFVFPTYPYVDTSGLMYVLSMNATYGAYHGAGVSADVNLRSTTAGLTLEASGIFQGDTLPWGGLSVGGQQNATANFNMQYAPYNASLPAALTTCAAANPNTAAMAPASLVTYSYCYYHLGSVAAGRSFMVSLVGTMTAYQTPVVGPRRPQRLPAVEHDGCETVRRQVRLPVREPADGHLVDAGGRRRGLPVRPQLALRRAHPAHLPGADAAVR